MNEKIIKIKSSEVLNGNTFLNGSKVKLYNREGSILFVLGRLGTGKSKILLRMIKIESVFLPKGKILFISLEQNKDLIKQRFKNEFNFNIDNPKLIVNDEQKLTIKDIEKIVDADNNIKVLVIDYIELIDSDKLDVIKCLKNMKERFKLNIIVASKLNKSEEVSSHIIENSDNVILIEDDIRKKHELLPIIDIKDDSFFELDKSKDKSKLDSLLNKYIIFELWDKKNHSIGVLPGKLLEISDKYLLIRQYDDGTEETKKLWNDYNGKDLFEEFEEKISIDNIRGIEEYLKYNPSLEFKEEYKNNICEVTNKNNKTITVMIRNFEEFNLEFDFKYQTAEGIFIGTNFYPFYFIKDIKVIKELNK